MKKCFNVVFIFCFLSACSVYPQYLSQGVISSNTLGGNVDQQDLNDEFDDLLDNAVSRGLDYKDIKLKSPNAFMLAVAKASIPFMRLYFYSVSKLRMLKQWVARQWESRRDYRFYQLLFGRLSHEQKI